MADREQVIYGLKCITEGFPCCQDCKYYGLTEEFDDCVKAIAADALELLKEQEMTEYGYNEYTNPACKSCGFQPFAGYIPTLKWMRQRGYNYCPGCGKAVKWDEKTDH